MQQSFKRVSRSEALDLYASEMESTSEFDKQLSVSARRCVELTSSAERMLKKMERYPENSRDMANARRRYNTAIWSLEEYEKIYGTQLAVACRLHKKRRTCKEKETQ